MCVCEKLPQLRSSMPALQLGLLSLSRSFLKAEQKYTNGIFK
jgi:hypothetical protein